MEYVKKKFVDEENRVISWFSTDDNVLCSDGRLLREKLIELSENVSSYPGVNSENEWGYIDTIETTEVVGSVVKNFDKEYSELYIKMFVENNSANAGGMLSFKINGKRMMTTNTSDFTLSIGKLGSKTRELLILNSLHPLTIIGAGGITTNTWQPTPMIGFNSDTYSNSPFLVGEKISKIEFIAGNSSTTFATGAKFIIYGK